MIVYSTIVDWYTLSINWCTEEAKGVYFSGFRVLKALIQAEMLAMVDCYEIAINCLAKH